MIMDDTCQMATDYDIRCDGTAVKTMVIGVTGQRIRLCASCADEWDASNCIMIGGLPDDELSAVLAQADNDRIEAELDRVRAELAANDAEMLALVRFRWLAWLVKRNRVALWVMVRFLNAVDAVQAWRRFR